MLSDSILEPMIRSLERSRPGRIALRTVRRWRSHVDPSHPRVLCVGYVKTGTTSFGQAMRQLGYSHYGYDPDLERCRKRGDLQTCLRWASHFNSLDDLPWSDPKFIEAYRQEFPNSYYVLLVRQEDEWLTSYFRFFGKHCSQDQALEKLRGHQGQTRRILRNEPHVLEMNICAGDGYEKLCPFLGLPIPAAPFPWIIPRS